MTVRTRFAPSPTGYPAHRRRAHRAVLLAGGAPSRRRIHPAHRGHRSRAFHARRPCRRSSTACTGSASTPTKARIYQTLRMDRYRAGRRRAAARRQGVLRLRDARKKSRRCATPRWRKGEKPRYNGFYRDRNEPLRDDPNRVIRFKNPPTAAVVFDDKVKGRVEWGNERARRSRADPLGRLPDLQLRGRRRRHRHEDQRGDPRRRPRQQHAAPDQYLPRARRAGAGVRAPADDPRPGRPEAVQAPRRGRRDAVSRRRLPAARAAELPGAPGLVARRPGDLLARGDDRSCSTSPTSTSRPSRFDVEKLSLAQPAVSEERRSARDRAAFRMASARCRHRPANRVPIRST